ncbi:MAG: 3-hydroxyacyl-ACP dehydratase FabZ [Desulfobulbaceae bacterium]|nr:3-hydroxyacyl-ACP dehydratase FabZ [Desulfobulbaceae bacterium]MCK5437995.1 3-hydroxyacyl-ACP dehydratase FabZ [Desulfobulbaceae bacterium]MCK5545188.1 3-hydroxyacyl-ACP dehydratase FabZ [Desulfobulbaceae bacterium]
MNTAPEKLDINEIFKLLPHRYPFVMVDRILEIELGVKIVGLKNVSMNEPYFQGHFPGQPVMPGVLILEGMAQIGGILGILSFPEKVGAERIFYFAGVDRARFRRPVTPGDQLIFELTILKTKGKIIKLEGKAFVDEKLVAESQLMATLAL